MTEAEGRAEYSTTALNAALETKMLLEAHGIETPSITGASSGSYAADAALPYFTELQAGSYALMDAAMPGSAALTSATLSRYLQR